MSPAQAAREAPASPAPRTPVNIARHNGGPNSPDIEITIVGNQTQQDSGGGILRFLESPSAPVAPTAPPIVYEDPYECPHLEQQLEEIMQDTPWHDPAAARVSDGPKRVRLNFKQPLNARASLSTLQEPIDLPESTTFDYDAINSDKSDLSSEGLSDYSESAIKDLRVVESNLIQQASEVPVLTSEDDALVGAPSSAHLPVAQGNPRSAKPPGATKIKRKNKRK